MTIKFENNIHSFKENLSEYLPGNSIDCIIFGYQNQELHILLLQWKFTENWALPGGFIDKEEDMDAAAKRILFDRTNLTDIFLKQFQTFGNKKRGNDKNKFKPNLERNLLEQIFGESEAIINWLSNRFISTGYFALVDLEKTNPKPDLLSEKCEWKPLKEIPTLIMDHNEIITKALEQLRIQLNHLPIGKALLPTKFTMQDLQKLYEAILQKPLERSNFQRKILKLDILNRHEKKMEGGSHKAPYLYSFDKIKYTELIKYGIGFL